MGDKEVSEDEILTFLDEIGIQPQSPRFSLSEVRYESGSKNWKFQFMIKKLDTYSQEEIQQLADHPFSRDDVRIYVTTQYDRRPEFWTKIYTLQPEIINFFYIEEFPYEILKLEQLHGLSFSRHRLKTIPGEVFEQFDLESFAVIRGVLTELPAPLYQCTSLRSLILTVNGFKEISPEITNLINLERLDLSGNLLDPTDPTVVKLKELYENGGLPNLKKLFI